MNRPASPPPAEYDRRPADPPEERPGVCQAHGSCLGPWCRIMRRCFQGEGV